MSEKDKLREHVYDGIQEYDNQLPHWWIYMFWISIAFGVAYMFWFHLGGTGDSLTEEFRKERAQLELVQLSKQTSAKILTEAELQAMLDDSSIKDLGQQVFVERCASCHLESGAGLVGPNLTDDYWIHGGSLTEIVHIVNEGVPEKGMLSWKAIMKADEIHAVSVYIKTLRGSNPANAKAPEGDLIQE